MLKDYKLIEIETVLKYNTFMDDNIFRYNQITKPILERFIDKFYKYRADKSLNQLYPGFAVILNFLKEKSDDELNQAWLDFTLAYFHFDFESINEIVKKYYHIYKKEETNEK